MSLARAFTTRRAKQGLQTADGDGVLHRSNTTKGFGSRSIRNKISGPVQLVHTTNMLSYNAPDILPKSASSTSSSARSDDDLSDSHNASPPTSPDVPSPPKQQTSTAEPNHLSCYFTPPGQTVVGAKANAPTIPQRAPSHTKKSYDGLGRQRSTSRLSEQSQRTVSTKASFTFSRASSSSTSTSATHNSTPSTPRHMPKIPSVSIPVPAPIPVAVTTAPAPPAAQPKKDFSPHNPFGPELAQVTEIAEEFGVRERLNIVDPEEQELAAKGLLKISAEEYLTEVNSLYASFFAEPRATPSAAWI